MSICPFGERAAEVQARTERRKEATEIYIDKPVKQKMEERFLHEVPPVATRAKKRLVKKPVTAQNSSDTDSDKGPTILNDTNDEVD